MASAPVTTGFAPAQAADDGINVAAQGAVMRLLNLANEQVRLKRQIEMRWLEDLRAYHGRHDEVTEARLNSDNNKRSRAFINLARAKTNAWTARIGDLLFPADGRNWGISPTPVPQLTEVAKAAAIEADQHDAAAAQKVEEANALEAQGPGAQGPLLAQAAEQGELALAARQREAEARSIQEEARKRAVAMEREIADQLGECRYAPRCRDIIDDAAKIGVGVIKGPVVKNRPRRRWEQQQNVYQLTRDPDPRPEYRRVNPWAFFPQMNATSMEEDCEFTFERHLPSRTELRRMTRTLGFDENAVRRLLEAGPDANSNTDLNHLNDLRAITGEGEAIKDRFVVWEYRGPLEPEEVESLLIGAGRAEDAARFAETADVLDEHMVVCWFSGTELLLLHEDYPLDSGESFYSVFSFEKGEASILGAIGIPRIIMDALRAANGAWRMMLDNGGLSVGPQVVVDKTQVTPQNGDWTLSAMKVWLKTGAEVANAAPPFQVFNIPSNQAQLAGIIELALKFIDEEASLPMLAQGEQGQASPTLGGMSMLFNSANVVFRRVVRNWDDDLTTPVIRRMYDWNMQFNPKEEIKGDQQVEARGTSVLLVREMMAQQLAGIVGTWTTHPKLSIMMKKEGFDAARELLQSLSINPDTILDDWDTVEARFKAMADAAAEGGQSPEEIRAQTQLQIAQLDAESRAADGQVQLQIADIRRQTELIKLASEHEISLEDLRTKLAIEQVRTDSKERIFAGELGFEAQAAREARASGAEPSGSGGYVSAGEEGRS